LTFAILAHVGMWQAAGGTLDIFEPTSGMTDLLGYAAAQTRLILAILAHVDV
jgi:hypothetical protein